VRRHGFREAHSKLSAAGGRSDHSTERSE